MTSLAAVSKLDAVESFVVSIGFGVDAFHGVCHAHVLENIAAWPDGGYLGAFAVTAAMPEGRAYLSAVSHAHDRMPGRTIVNGSMAAAMKASLGTSAFDRTAQSQLFINPLMAIYFAFDFLRWQSSRSTFTSSRVPNRSSTLAYGSRRSGTRSGLDREFRYLTDHARQHRRSGGRV